MSFKIGKVLVSNRKPNLLFQWLISLFNLSLFSSSFSWGECTRHIVSQVWLLEVCWGWFRTYHRLERVHFPFTMYSRHKALFIGLRRRWCFFEKRNSISVDLRRYWSKFHTLRRSIRRFNFPPLGRLNSWLFPLNPPSLPGPKLCSNTQPKFIFWKRKTRDRDFPLIYQALKL